MLLLGSSDFWAKNLKIRDAEMVHLSALQKKPEKVNQFVNLKMDLL